MNYRMIKFIVGKMLLMEGVLLLIPAFVSLLYQESSGVYFLIVTAALLVLSLLLSRKPESLWRWPGCSGRPLGPCPL